MGMITFNGVDLSMYGLYVSGDSAYNSPSKSYEKVSVPGRSGDLLILNDKYDNVDISYPAIIVPPTGMEYAECVERIRSTLISSTGYCKLLDTYHPGKYRMAHYTGPFDLSNLLFQAGSFTLSFNCKPQVYLDSGDEWIVSSANNTHFPDITLTNPTAFTTLPFIKVKYPRSTVEPENVFRLSFAIVRTSPYINIYPCEINYEYNDDKFNDSDGYFYIDFEKKDCYLYEPASYEVPNVHPERFYNMNYAITITDMENIYIKGNETVRIANNDETATPISEIQILPRWYEI